MHHAEPKRSVESVLSHWRSWPLQLNDRPRVVRHLNHPEGINETLLIESGESRFVLKFRRNTPDCFERNWLDELRAARAAASLGMTPEILCASEVDQFLLMSPINCRSLSDCENLPSQLGELLSRLHSLQQLDDATSKNALKVRDYRSESRRYLDSLHSIDPQFSSRHRSLFDQVIQSANVLFEDNHETVCHHDLSVENLLFDGEKVYLIDWEYACRAHPQFDLTCLNNLVFESVQQKEEFARAYLGPSGRLCRPEIENAADRLFHFYALAWNYHLLGRSVDPELVASVRAKIDLHLLHLS